MAKDKYYSPVPAVMGIVTILGIIGCILFGVLYDFFNHGWMFSCAITFGMFAYHMLIRFMSPVIIQLISHKKYNYKSKWFQTTEWEQKIYKKLKVKKWKKRVMTYDPRQFSLELNSVEEIINNMCHAEVVHELIVILSFTSILFAVPFGAFGVFMITAILAALVDCMFVVIQRYNRPRLVRIVETQI